MQRPAGVSRLASILWLEMLWALAHLLFAAHCLHCICMYETFKTDAACGIERLESSFEMKLR